MELRSQFKISNYKFECVTTPVATVAENDTPARACGRRRDTRIAAASLARGRAAPNIIPRACATLTSKVRHN